MRMVSVVFALFSACCLAHPTSNNLLEDVLTTVEKGLKFFSEDYSSINVDGLFGLRLGQGQIRAAVHECKSRTCGEGLLSRLQSLDKQLGEASDSALPYVEQADSAYYQRFEATINMPYVLPYKPTPFNDNHPETGSNTHYGEEYGDACYARMLGTYVENDKVIPKCNITKPCLEYMKKEKTSGYFITHQLLYFIMIEHVGCRESVESFMNDEPLFEIETKLCNKIYEESRQLEHQGKVNTNRKDLFLEQTVLCGTLGFEDFMRSDWMKMVLSWPDKRLGCFKNDFMKTILELEQEQDTNPSAVDIQQGDRQKDKEHKPFQNEKSSAHTMRKLLREKSMKDGCLSHTSGLGFGVICTYLRYLVRYI